MLLGVYTDPNIRDLDVNISSNNLRVAGTDFIDTCFQTLQNMATLDISDNGFDQTLPMVLDQLSKNKGLKKLVIGKTPMPDQDSCPSCYMQLSV